MPDPLPIKRPATPDEMAAAVSAAGASGAQVRAAGGDSLPLTRFAPARPVQFLSTLRLNQILWHAADDMTVCVQAGLSLEALQRQLAWRDQWLPVDPPVIALAGRTPGGRTIGGLIASNSLGPLRFGLAGGDWRRLILGIRWIDAAGALIKGGGQTVKNVAGYSSPRMLIGSAGSLGIIAEVTLRTFARPADEQALVFFCPDAGHAEELLAAILASPAAPAYLQLIGTRTFAGNPLQLPVPDHGGPILFAGFLGRPEACAAQLEILRSLPAARTAEAIAQTAAQAGRLRLWMTTEPALPQSPEAGGVGFRLHVPSAHTAGLLASLEAQTPGSWLVAEAQGVIRGTLPAPGAAALLSQLAPGSPLLITQGSAPLTPPDPLSARLKLALDPQGIFGHDQTQPPASRISTNQSHASS